MKIYENVKMSIKILGKYFFAILLTAVYSCSSSQNHSKKETMKQSTTDTTRAITEMIDSTEITHRYAMINGIRYHYTEAGRGPLVVMLHGFPELWYSWRHQLAALANAGYHAVAPDLRGFGESEVTPDVSDYSLLQHAKDVKALIDHIGAKDAVVAGHDWGANLMWTMPMLYPETIKAAISLSIPFYPEPRDPAEIRKKWASVFTNFEKKGVIEAEFEKEPELFFRLFFYGLSGDAPAGTLNKLYVQSTPKDRLIDLFPQTDELPSWLTQEDLDYYVNAYKKTGITGALNFYRNTDEDYPRLKELYKKGINQPVLFVGGGEEAAVKFGSTEPMKAALPGLKKIIILPGCGHWLQQERPGEVNAAIIEFLNREYDR
jgi:pimeloyl-ACP methyl ester carboxylesterase